jgi:chromosome segregation ATPase
LSLINDPRADLNKISAELIKLEGKRIDLESTKSRLQDELTNTESQNKALEQAINKKKESLMQSTNQRQDSLRDAQTKTEFQITTLKKEQAELKTKVNELLKLNEDVSLFFI